MPPPPQHRVGLSPTGAARRALPGDEWRGLLQAGGGYSEIYASPDSPTPPSLFLGEYYPAALASPHRSEPASGRLGAAGAGAPAAPYPAPSMAQGTGRARFLDGATF